MHRGLNVVSAVITAVLLAALAIVLLNPDPFGEPEGHDRAAGPTATVPLLVATSIATPSVTAAPRTATPTVPATQTATSSPTETPVPTLSPTPTATPLPECLITGQVMDTDDGGPLVNVVLGLREYREEDRKTLIPIAGRTDAQGKFVLSCDEIPEESFPIEVTMWREDWLGIWSTYTLVEEGGRIGTAMEVSLCQSLAPTGDPVATVERIDGGPTRKLTIELNGNSPSYDFRAWTLHAGPSFGDFAFNNCDGPSFYSNNGRPPDFFQKGVIDLGGLGDVPLETIVPPVAGYERMGVPAVVDHTYVSPTLLEPDNHVIFRLFEVETDGMAITKYVLEFYYRVAE